MKLVPFAVIQEAKKFDTEAVEFVFRHFAGFIASKCQRHYTDEYGKNAPMWMMTSAIRQKSHYSEPLPVFNSESRPMIFLYNISVWQECAVRGRTHPCGPEMACTTTTE